MAKRILLDILVKVLGEYIELDAENFDLSLAVWSGHIALKNLKVSDIEREVVVNTFKITT
jgi:N-terminal region of Chorein or VPS13